ncbi:M48 family metalloprotease [Methylococcus sp. EFPC2]|uniref:M48 family metalloprotease n=1 Tax=Methylococcus sp. EFPC2 TaxID=2812648 RepID=UPI0019682565|nr:M48 family metalloprotease [Methylococcus sp. EFPC2]QSA98523.1 M48 family metallopeptidase [Methylococcus sp. EFPC2]
MSTYQRSLALLLTVVQLALPYPIIAAEGSTGGVGDTPFLESDPLKQGQKTINLPEIGDSTGTLFTPLQEKQLGEAFFRSLHNEVEVNQDPEIGDYIQTIGQKLAGNSDNPSQTFHFFVVSDASINAFAGPGGYIGVNSGLIIASESESELASVMAHEIAHVTQRHLYQAYQAASRLSLPTAAAMLAAIALGAATGSGQVGQAAILATQAANTQFQINFTRDNEAEADRVGMQTLSRSTFDPRAMPIFFERLQQSTRYAGRNLPEFLLTHPVTVSRISDTRSRAEKFPYRQYPDSFQFQLIRAKLRVQVARSPREALDYFKAVSGQGTAQQQEVAQYGLALALVADGQFGQGKQILQQLASRHVELPNFINALARAEYELKNYNAAFRLYETALQRFPGNQAVTLNYIKALLATNRAKEARALLQDYAQHETPTAEIYELLAQAYGALGQEAESHRYLAEHYYASGQTRAAILQLRIARNFAGDSFYINAVIDERLKQFMEEEAERKKEK